MKSQTNWKLTTASPLLESDSVHIWLCTLDPAAAALAQHRECLDAGETARCARLVNERLRTRFIAAHGFTRRVLSLYSQRHACDLTFSLGEHGKPVLPQHSDLHFNLSHSHDLAILAIASRPVGIDIEYIDGMRDWQGIMQRFYTASEVQKILALPAAMQQQAFFQVWTRKEAHMKVTGKGLHLAPGQFTVSVPPEPAALLDLDSGEDVSQWQMFDIPLPAIASRYCACLSVAGTASQLHTFMFA